MSTVPILQKAEQVFAKLKEGYVLHEATGPGKKFSELTLVNGENVEFEVPGVIFRTLEKCFRTAPPGMFNDDVPKVIFMQEPGCAPTWCIVAADNELALQYQVSPEKALQLLYTRLMDNDGEEEGGW